MVIQTLQGSNILGDIVLKWYNGFCFLVVVSIIASCSLIAPMTTSSTTAKQLGFFKTTVEVVSSYYTDKTATDHAVSVILGKDCKMSRVAKREDICNEIKPKAYDDKFTSKFSNILNESKMNMVLNLRETNLVNSNQNFADVRKKVDDIKKNNVEVLKNHDSETLAHNVLNNRNIIKDNSNNFILADNLLSIYNLLAKNTNETEFGENLQLVIKIEN